MGAAMKDPVPLLAYAYELQEGDELHGRIVTSVEDPDRPTHGGHAWSDGTPGGEQHGEAVIHFDGGETQTWDRLTEFALVRDRSRTVWATGDEG